MDDKLRALRAAKHQQYLQLHPEERPHQEVCPQCKETIIKKISICPATGLYHHHEALKYIGNVIIDGNVVSSDVARRAANSKIVKWESAHTLKVRADATALNIFQSFVQQRDYQLQRFGYLYGKYNVEQKEIEVHCIYEPEQNGTPFTFEELPDPFLEKADAVAKLLGFRRVGAIVSHPPRDPSEMQLSSRECLLMTREQCKYGRECVLLTIAPNTTDGVVECLAWQSSSLCQDYFKLGQLKENTRPVEVVKQAMKEDDPHIFKSW
ncbi:NPL4 family, putative [Angomonas deanei]|uniref:NPL4 family, putative n=1 Tax=Angomonas deanei TaxID=59799 RepID=A0A7G2CF16_9TRYP|nr:NPL4 family, putative [Angomonas deanei]